MDNVTFIEIEFRGVIQTHAIIDRGNGEYTSMPKAFYDEQQAQAALSTPFSTPNQLEEQANDQSL
jgi:hypothetical protein